MKILNILEPGKAEWHEAPVPRPGAGEVLMRVEAVTTCPRWDIHARRDLAMFEGSPFIYPITSGQPGHEAAGTVAAVGADVTEFADGDRIVAWRAMGMDRPGCYAQYVVLPQENLLHVPESVSLTKVASLELGMCVGASFLRLKSFDAIRGRRFGVMGLGPAGLVAAQIARAEGAAEVVGFDLSPQRRTFASQILDSAFDPRETGNEFPVRSETARLDTTIDCVGAKTSVEWAMDHTEEFVALFGVQHDDYTYSPRHNMNLVLCGYPMHSRAAAEYALELVEKGLLNLELLSTHQLPLAQYEDGIDLLESQQAIKICYDPWQGN